MIDLWKFHIDYPPAKISDRFDAFYHPSRHIRESDSQLENMRSKYADTGGFHEIEGCGKCPVAKPLKMKPWYRRLWKYGL